MDVVIIGAGLTGLQAANLLSDSCDITILEKDSRPGGLVKSEQIDNFTYDCTGHFLHFKDKSTKKFIEKLLPEGTLLKIERKSYIYTRQKYVPYPFQSHINYLPEKIRRKCLIGFLKSAKNDSKDYYENFYEWMIEEYGPGIVEEFMLPYNNKMWTVHPQELTTAWMGRFVPRPNPEDIVAGIISEGKKKEGYNAEFYYPEGGIGKIIDKLSEKVDNIQCGVKVEKIDLEKKEVLAGNKRYKYDKLINTSSLKEFSNNIKGDISDRMFKSGKKLRNTSLLYFNVGWEGPPGPSVPEGTHWIYFPEEKFKFYRVGFPSNLNARVAPEGKSSAYVEISFKPSCFPDQDEISAIREETVKELISAGIIPSLESILHVLPRKIDTSYVIYDKNYESCRQDMIKTLEKNDIHTGGRYGGWEYSSMEDALKWARLLADRCLKQ